MRFLWTLVALPWLTAAALAECPAGSPNVLRLVSWEAATADDGFADLEIVYENVSDQPIQMIDAILTFQDALGGHIGTLAVERDLTLAPSEQGRQNFIPTIKDWRLPKLSPETVTADICTRAVLYADGTREDF